ncbi:MAG: DUF1275 domain-containing protein [Myxococcaceae bacterium]|nr:DUF1275 domain-containing protein [Myxococcaceae bacterium]
MFTLEGPGRKPHHNRVLAATLSIIAGFVNSAGFMLVGSFTSHVTGHAGRLASDVAEQKLPSAASAFLLVLAFFSGAFVANMVLLTRIVRRRPLIYAALLFLEGGLLATFVQLINGVVLVPEVPVADAEASILCFAMGVQNSMVTLISDARVRTTHLTGVVTDLGIEAARWVRFLIWRAAPTYSSSVPPPQPATALLLLNIFGGFMTGGVLGALSTQLWGAQAMYAPALAASLAGAYAVWSGTRAPAAPATGPS